MTANAPMLAIVPDAGIVLALLGTPLLWAAYFLALPKITSRILRLFAVAVVASVHLGTAAWMSSRDEYFGRVFERFPSLMVLYFGVLIVAVLTLGVVSVARARELRLS
jgi:hypothetical protein